MQLRLAGLMAGALLLLPYYSYGQEEGKVVIRKSAAADTPAASPEQADVPQAPAAVPAAINPSAETEAADGTAGESSQTNPAPSASSNTKGAAGTKRNTQAGQGAEQPIAGSNRQGLTAATDYKVPDRLNFSGYFRIAGRYDGENDNRLGWWTAYGRLLNETSWLTMQLDNHLIVPQKADDERTTLVLRIEGGSLRNADGGFGRLDNYRVTQIYLETENVAIDNFVTTTGTIWYNMGYIGIYDLYVSQIFWETVGMRAGQRWNGRLEYQIGVGDSGYNIYNMRQTTEPNYVNTGYNPVPTAGAVVRANLADLKPFKAAFPFTNYFWVGMGAQFHVETENPGSPNAPHTTPNISYEDYLRGEVLKNYLKENPDRLDDFPNAESTSAFYYKATGWVGFNLKRKLGPVRLNWNDLSISVVRKRPDMAVREAWEGQERNIYVSSLTDERYEIYIVDEMQWSLIHNLLDMNIGLLYSSSWDDDNKISPGDNNRQVFSVVIRPQYYFTKHLHALLEVSLAREVSSNGNMFREHHDSIEESRDGLSYYRGLEWGDADTKDTFQIKFGPVFNPNGRGIYNRPSIRLLFGAQYSNVHAAFGNSRVQSLEQRNNFNFRKDVHWHYIVSLEAEHWWGSF
jgi:maltoporin